MPRAISSAASLPLWCWRRLRLRRPISAAGLSSIVCALAAGAVLWEWTMLVAKKPEPRIIAPGLAALFVAAGLVGATAPTAAIATIAIGALVVGGLVAFWPRCVLPPLWAAGGVIYAGVVLLAPTLLRNDPQFGLQALLLLVRNRLGDRYFRLSGRPRGRRPVALAAGVARTRPGRAPSAVSLGGLPRALRSPMRAGEPGQQ